MLLKTSPSSNYLFYLIFGNQIEVKYSVISLRCSKFAVRDPGLMKSFGLTSPFQIFFCIRQINNAISSWRLRCSDGQFLRWFRAEKSSWWVGGVGRGFPFSKSPHIIFFALFTAFQFLAWKEWCEMKYHMRIELINTHESNVFHSRSKIH